MKIIFYNLFVICFVSFTLLLLNCSTIIETFAKITNLRRLFKIDNFYAYKREIDLSASYSEFLYNKYPNYLTELFSCNICLCFWINLMVVFIVNFLVFHYVLTTLLIVPITYIFSLLLFLIIKKLL